MVLFLILEKYIRKVNFICVVIQFGVSIVVFIAVVIRYKQDQVSSDILWGIFRRYTVPHFSFCFLVFAIIN